MKNIFLRSIWLLFLAFWLLDLAICHSAMGRDIGYTEDPTKIGMGARPLGMGRAFVAIADEENAIFINPSGLARSKKWALSSMYASLLGDVNYITLNLAYPIPAFKNGGFAIGYVGSNVPGIISPTQEGFLYSDYHNNVYLLGIGIEPKEGFSLGAGLKIFDQGFAGHVDSVGKGTDLDIGLRWEMDKRLGLGVNFQNILPPELGGKITWPNGDVQSIPAVAKVGLKGLTEDEKLLFAIDYDLQLDKKLPGTGHIGAEWKFHPQLALRAGLDQNLSAMTGNTATNLSLGVGLEIGAIKFDYAYHPYYDESSNITHYISFSISGKPYSPKEKKKEALRTATTESFMSIEAVTLLSAEAKSLPSLEATPLPTAEAEKQELTEKNVKTSLYRVVCGPFEDEVSAKISLVKLRSRGFEGLIKQNEGNIWFVQAGAFRSEENALKLKDQLEINGIKTIIKQE